MDDSIMTDATEMGKIVETAVYKHIAAFYYQFATSVGYFRGGKKGKEIDVVVDYPNIKNMLIEVKYREKAPIADDSAIVELCDEASAAIVVTKMQMILVYTTQTSTRICLESRLLPFCICLEMQKNTGIEE